MLSNDNIIASVAHLASLDILKKLVFSNSEKSVINRISGIFAGK